jgi:hypothetical protein
VAADVAVPAGVGLTMGTVTGSAKAPEPRARNSEMFQQKLFDFRQNFFHLGPAKTTHGMTLDVAE